MVWGNVGVIKIIGGGSCHAEAFHDASGRLVGGDGEGNDLLEIAIFEAEGEGGAGGFGRVAVSPVFVEQPPTDFDAGVKWDSNFGMLRPTNPTKSAMPTASTAQRPKP